MVNEMVIHRALGTIANVPRRLLGEEERIGVGVLNAHLPDRAAGRAAGQAAACRIRQLLEQQAVTILADHFAVGRCRQRPDTAADAHVDASDLIARLIQRACIVSGAERKNGITPDAGAAGASLAAQLHGAAEPDLHRLHRLEREAHAHEQRICIIAAVLLKTAEKRLEPPRTDPFQNRQVERVRRQPLDADLRERAGAIGHQQCALLPRTPPGFHKTGICSPVAQALGNVHIFKMVVLAVLASAPADAVVDGGAAQFMGHLHGRVHILAGGIAKIANQRGAVGAAQLSAVNRTLLRDGQMNAQPLHRCNHMRRLGSDINVRDRVVDLGPRKRPACDRPAEQAVVRQKLHVLTQPHVARIRPRGRDGRSTSKRKRQSRQQNTHENLPPVIRKRCNRQ